MKSSAYEINELLKKIVSLRGGKVKYFVKHKSISMKKIYILFVFLLIATININGQSTTNSMAVGGFFATKYVSGEVDNSNFFSGAFLHGYNQVYKFSARFSPYCVFSTDNRNQYGFRLNLAYSKSKNNIYVQVDNGFRTIDQLSTNQGYGVGFFYRNYLTDNEAFNIFFQSEINAEYALAKIKTSFPSSSKHHYVAFAAGIRPGLSYDFSERLKFILNAGIISYSYIIDKLEGFNDWGTSHNFEASLSLSSFLIGLEYQL